MCLNWRKKLKSTPIKLLVAGTVLLLASGCVSKRTPPPEPEPLPSISFVPKQTQMHTENLSGGVAKGNVSFHNSRLTGLKLSDVASGNVTIEQSRSQLSSGLALRNADATPSSTPVNSAITIAYNKGDTAEALLTLIAQAYKLTVNVNGADKARLSMLVLPNDGQLTFKTAEQALDGVLSPMGMKWQLVGSQLNAYF